MADSNYSLSGQNDSKNMPTLPPKNAKFADSETTKYKVFYILKTALLILFSSILVAIAVHCFINPNGFTIGGIAGLAVTVSYVTNGVIKPSIIVFCLNTPLLIISYFFVKKRFALLSIANTFLQSLWLSIFESTAFPVVQFQDSGLRIFAAVAAGVCLGVAIAFALKAGGSTGGLDVIAVMIQKKTSFSSIPQVIAILSSSVILVDFFIRLTPEQDLSISLLPILLSLVEVYSERKANDAITNGYRSAIEFRVVTDKPEELATALMTELSRGVTVLPAKGMFMNEEHSLLFCVVGNNQINAFKRIIKQVDPDSFAVLSNVSQVVGLGFYQDNN
jgi:uncharacterized membrane-anchored protein YitT (DUF2179 family)